MRKMRISSCFNLCVLLAALALFAFSACAKKPVEVIKQPGDDKIKIITTIFPQYDWTRQIIGDENMGKCELTLLIDSRIDLHNYNPSVQDIAKMKTCDVLIYVGGASDSWIDDILADANPDMIALNLVETLEALDLLDEHDHDPDDCDEDHDHDDHDDDEAHADEHVWLSLRLTNTLCAVIADMLAELDPGSAQVYKDNYTAYADKLSALDAEYQAAVDAADFSALVFADRFPFYYLMDDYGLTHHAAFDGCSAETEASFATIISLADSVDRLELSSVMVTESSNQAIAKTVINETRQKNQQILVLDSMQSVTSNDVINGVTYLSIMESNLAVLKKALR